MPAKKNSKVPSYRLHKATGQAVVTLNNRDFYLGRHSDPTSKEKYDRLIAQWLANGRRMPISSEANITVTEMIAAFWRHAQAYYRKPDGTPTTTLDNFRQALRPLKRLYGSTDATKFGPRALQDVQEEMIRLGWCRPHINRQVSRVKSVFRWAVSRELVSATVYHALVTVPGLKVGRSEAPEPKTVKPVPEPHIHAIKPYVSRHIWALIQLQRLTAARPGELVIMRTIDLDTTGRIWTYTPQTHKNAYRDHKRVIYIGPRAQEILTPFMTGRALDAYTFSPKEAAQEHRAKRHASRITPLSCGNRPGSKRIASPHRQPGDRYTTGSYRRAIARACRVAQVPSWSPHQLRHSAATLIRKEYGLEAAQLMLGHTKADVTQLYAEVNRERAVQVATQIG